MLGGRCHTLLLTVSLILMVSGNLRDLVTSLGYWGMWGVWCVVTLVATRTAQGAFMLSHPPAWVMVSYTVLGLGMLLSAVVNKDLVSAYQALKIGVIAGVFVAMWRLVWRLNWSHLLLAMRWSIAIVLLSFAASKVWNPAGQVLIHGLREGSFLALYGVLWKAGAFFVPIFLADAIKRPNDWIRNGLMIAACIFLVLIDGSRTGLLLLGAIIGGFFFFLIWIDGWGGLRRQVRWMWAALALLVLLQLLNSGLNMGLDRLRTKAAVPSASVGAVTAAAPAVDPARILEEALDRTFETRIGMGDPARVRLLKASMSQIIPCQPFGCGFKTTGTDIVGTGELMPVHNAYLAALGDFGILGLAGMLGFLMAAVPPIWRVLRQGDRSAQGLFVVAASGSALAYGMALMLNTFSTEMSEWGYLILMLAFAWAPAKST